MPKHALIELIFNLFLAAIIGAIFVIVPTTYVIEGYINILIYISPFLYNKLVTTEETIHPLRCLEIVIYGVLIIYCIICIFSFPYPQGKKFIYEPFIHIYFVGVVTVFFSLFANISKK